MNRGMAEHYEIGLAMTEQYATGPAMIEHYVTMASND